VLRVAGLSDAGLDALSDRICTALQLLNHLQDLGEDLRDRDRIYFPQEHLARHGVAEADLGAPSASPGVRALVREWHARVTAMFARGWPLVTLVRGRLRLELRAILWGAALCLRRIAAADFDVLGVRTRLSRLDKVSLPLRALLGSQPRELR
jgi:phytoene/squalene synthetase